MPEVRTSADFARVAALPRRVVSYDDAVAWAATFTEELRMPGGTRRLKPWQGAAIAEAVEHDGLFAGLPVGFGKTDLAWCLPRAMRSRTSVLIVPAALEAAMRAEFSKLVTQWRSVQSPPYLLTAQKLAHPDSPDLLFKLNPDLIMVDEADELQNRKAAVCRRIDRYVVARQDDVRVCLFTGTPSRKSLLGYWHHLCWALRDRAPVPLHESEAEEWGLAIDDFGLRVWAQRMRPGPLGRSVAEARKWFAERLAQTPGVLIVDGDSAGDIPLSVELVPSIEDPIIDGHYETFLDVGENPAGIPVTDPLSRWRTDGQLGTGIYLRYAVPPPQPWRDSLRTFAKFCRETIDASTCSARPLDTEAQVVRAYSDAQPVKAWRTIGPTFEPETVAVRLSDSAVRAALEWLAASPEPAIIWCGSVEIGLWISQVGKLPYYGREGRERTTGKGLHEANPKRSLVASWHANKRGFNLQPWRRALLVHPPQSAKYLEQIFGRHHRAGQTEPVRITVLCTSGGTYDAFEAALSEASFARETISLTQKILRADVTRTAPTITTSNAFRWARKKR